MCFISSFTENIQSRLYHFDCGEHNRTMNKLNIIFVDHQRKEAVSGGQVIRERNKKLFKSISNVFIDYTIRPYSLGRIRRICGLFNKIEGYKFSDDQNLIRLIRENNIDLVVFATSRCGSVSSKIFKLCKTVTLYHNVEYSYFKQEQRPQTLKGKINLLRNLRKLKFCERRLTRKSTLLIGLNKRDSDGLKKLYGRGTDYTWPTTFKDCFNPGQKSDSQEKVLLFVGYNFFGNTDGLFWFIENCLDSIDCKLRVVGNGMDLYKDKYPEKNVEFIGFVPDLSQEYVNADGVLLPIISGSGMKTKTCEALMYGKKIFGTKEAFEGYSGIEKTDCVECNSKKEFIDAINEFYSGNEKPKKFFESCRNLFLEQYEEKRVQEKLISYLESELSK